LTCQEIRNATGFENISCYTVDLSIFSSVVSFAEDFERAEGRLDIFMYNAGVSLRTYEPTVDGWESTYAERFLSFAFFVSDVHGALVYRSTTFHVRCSAFSWPRL
jgi:NAD(P)-dependent dehydrogenase (short-subunit alcohol dehydrogenase family)